MADYRGDHMRLYLKLALSLAFLLTSGLVHPVAAYGESLSVLFEKLKDSGEDYENAGAVCEQVARIELQGEYPEKDYEVHTGIIYADNTRIIGELDVVVFDRKRGSAVLVGEVKCWSDLSKARKKAAAQRKRFMDKLASGASLDFFLATDKGVGFRREQFSGLSRFIAISQRGGRAHGFDRDLDNSLSEMRELREALMRCQAAGRCRRPD